MQIVVILCCLGNSDKKKYVHVQYRRNHLGCNHTSHNITLHAPHPPHTCRIFSILSRLNPQVRNPHEGQLYISKGSSQIDSLRCQKKIPERLFINFSGISFQLILASSHNPCVRCLVVHEVGEESSRSMQVPQHGGGSGVIAYSFAL